MGVMAASPPFLALGFWFLAKNEEPKTKNPSGATSLRESGWRDLQRADEGVVGVAWNRNL
jgi:hypothetical protein